jgi:hypothetical protein
MARCNSTIQLEVHHKNSNGGNNLSNAEVLCHKCHQQTLSYGRPHGSSPPLFSEETKRQAMQRAGNRCECERTTCNHFSILDSLGLPNTALGNLQSTFSHR